MRCAKTAIWYPRGKVGHGFRMEVLSLQTAWLMCPDIACVASRCSVFGITVEILENEDAWQSFYGRLK